MLLWKVFGGRWFRLNCWQILWGRLDPNSSLPFFERNPITEYWKQGAMRWHSPTGWCWCYDVWNCAQVELWQMPKDGNSTSNHVVPISIMINTRILEKHLTSLGFMPWFHWPWQQKDSKLKCILLQISGKKIESPSVIYSKTAGKTHGGGIFPLSLNPISCSTSPGFLAVRGVSVPTLEIPRPTAWDVKKKPCK